VRRFLLLLVTCFALLATSAGAQSPSPAVSPVASPAASPESDTLPGLRYVAARQYAPDPSSPIDMEDTGVFIVTVRVYQFDTEAHAGNGWKTTVEDSTIESEIPADSDKVTYEEADLDGLGDRARVTTLAAETPEGDTGYFRLIYVQDGAYLYTLNAIAGSADATLVVDDIGAFMVDQEPGSGDVAFNQDGTSTGGVWDLLPPSDSDILANLIAFADAELDLTGS